MQRGMKTDRLLKTRSAEIIVCHIKRVKEHIFFSFLEKIHYFFCGSSFEKSVGEMRSEENKVLMNHCIMEECSNSSWKELFFFSKVHIFCEDFRNTLRKSHSNNVSRRQSYGQWLESGHCWREQRKRRNRVERSQAETPNNRLFDVQVARVLEK